MISRNILLTDQIVTLRPIGPEDTNAVVEAIVESVSEIMPWMTWCTPEYSRSDAHGFLSSLLERWNQGQQFGFAVTDSKFGNFLGGASLSHINYTTRLANLSYWIRTNATGRGYATRATRLIAEFGIRQLGLLRAEIIVAVGNNPSLRVAKNSGAQREGVLRNRLIVREKEYDAVMHSLTPEDFGL
jgi:RimJ/RimL family protein N-acetyltransferase